VLSRYFAANFVHKMALSSCIDKHKNVQAHFVLFVNAWLNCYIKYNILGGLPYEKQINENFGCITFIH